MGHVLNTQFINQKVSLRSTETLDVSYLKILLLPLTALIKMFFFRRGFEFSQNNQSTRSGSKEGRAALFRGHDGPPPKENLIEVGQYFNLFFYMSLDANEPDKGQVFVKSDDLSRSAIFDYNQGEFVRNSLRHKESSDARNVIIDFKEIFLEYLKEYEENLEPVDS